MTQQAATFDTYDAYGIREDLVDAIYRTDTSETPFLSAIAKVRATATNHEWQTDDLGSPATNYAVEGDDAAAGTITATARLGNYTQILQKTILITGTQRAVNTAGRRDELEYQTALAAIRLRKDVEFAQFDNNAKVAGNSTTAREMAGIPAWVKTNYDKNGQTMATGDGTDAVSGGTNAALTEARFKSVLQQTWAQGGNPTMVFCNAYNKQVISGFSGNGTRLIMANSNKLDAAYDVYASDFGEVKVIPSRHCETNMVYIIDPSLWGHAVLRDFSTVDLAKDGDSDKRQILIECTLEARNEKGNGIIVGVSPS